MRDWKTCAGIVDSLARDFAELEIRWYAKCIQDNKRAARMPARKRKALYGKHKLPWSWIHDEYICHKHGGFL